MLRIINKNGKTKRYRVEDNGEKTPDGIPVIMIKEIQEGNCMYESFIWESGDTEDYQSERHAGKYKEIEISVFKIRGLDQYMTTCRSVGLLAVDLENENIEEAKKEAVSMVVNRIKYLNSILKGLEDK